VIKVAALAALVLVMATVRAESSESFATPSPSVIEQFRGQYESHEWLRVSLGTTQLKLQARHVDEAGLSGLKAQSIDQRRLEAYISDPASKGHLTWSSISQIDQLHSRRRAGQITGFITAGIFGAANTGRPLIGAVAFGLAGAWLFGGIGDKFVSTRTLYVAEPVTAPSSIASATPQAAASPEPDSLDAAPRDTSLASPNPSANPATPPPTREAVRASQAITPETLLRIEADFGYFEGYALRIGPEGLDGLRADRNSEPLQVPPPGLVGWDEIYRLEKRGGSSGRGAISGALAVGLLGGMVSAAAVSVAQSDVGAGSAFVAGAAFGGAIGAALGGIVGAAIPGWHVVYQRPAHP
jgi:hypothetical protein